MNRFMLLAGIAFLSTACTAETDPGSLSGQSALRQSQSEQTKAESAMPTAAEQVAKDFQEIALQWEQHCQNVAFSSSMDDRLKTPAYERLVQLGPPTVPLIFSRWANDKDDERRVPWYFALEDITGVQMIEDRNWFSPREAEQAWRDWWEKAGKQDY
jgi:hypothetical protein